MLSRIVKRALLAALVVGVLIGMTACNSSVGYAQGIGSDKVVLLSTADPNSHLQEAIDASKPNSYFPKYDLVPSDVRKDAFFDDDILKWDSTVGWKAEFHNCRNEVFCLSMDQALRGKKNAKIEMTTLGSDSKVTLTPPSPIKIDKDFNVADLWIFGKYHQGTVLGISFKLKDGSIYKWTGGTDSMRSPGMLFANWTMGHVAFPKIVENGAELISFELIPPAAGDYLFHIDQMRVLDMNKYLATTPASKYTHTGDPVKLPVDPSGACPKTVGKVRTSVEMKDGNGYLKYTTKSGEEVTYIYTPKSGTLSDLSVNVKGKSPFKPADGSGPTFDYSGKSLDQGTADYKAECLSQKVDGDGLLYSWRYTVPAGTTNITYRFSLKGKTLQIQADSNDCNVSAWQFGRATGPNCPRVIEVPFMRYGPNMLCYDGMFTTYYADWYKSNVSVTSRFGIEQIKMDYLQRQGEAWYAGDDYRYWPRTDGKRYPLKECFYITTSSTFDDCLPSISNPPSPFKQVLSERLVRVIEGSKDYLKNVRAMVDLYDKYGMTKLYLFFANGFCNRGFGSSEPFSTRMTVSAATLGGEKAYIDLFKYISDKGMYPGIYGGFNFYQPTSMVWNYDDVAIQSDGSWQAGWVQSYHMKPWKFPELANTFYKEQAAKFGMKTIYEDGWTVGMPWDQNDYDHRIPGSGRMIDSIEAMAAGFRNERNAINGPVFSEGSGVCFYTAGLDDGDYGKMKDYYNPRFTVEEKRHELLVDFELRKVQPLHSPIGIDLGYQGYTVGPNGADITCGDYKYLYNLLSTEIAFNTIGLLEPYAWMPSDPTEKFDASLTSYFMIQQLQKRYIMETVDDIKYFDGERLITTSQAVLNEKYKDNMLRISYKNGLVVYVNCNWDGKNWLIEDGGKKYDLPSGGWYASQGRKFIEYSAMVDGRRIDFVDSPEYTYINPHGKSITLAGLNAEKITILHKTGKHKDEILTFPESH